MRDGIEAQAQEDFVFPEGVAMSEELGGDEKGEGLEVEERGDGAGTSDVSGREERADFRGGRDWCFGADGGKEIGWERVSRSLVTE